jgi:hypothetical protein
MEHKRLRTDGNGGHQCGMFPTFIGLVLCEPPTDNVTNALRVDKLEPDMRSVTTATILTRGNMDKRALLAYSISLIMDF